MTNGSPLRELFENPSAEYRSMPFWAWNDELQQDELVRQIHEMHQQGMGGFFMHSRDGLETPYLGEEWLAAVRTSAALAEQLGMKAWLYDEDRWPSGTAGGTVPAMGDAFRAKGLTLEIASGASYEDDGSVAALFKAVVQERQLIRCERLAMGAAIELAEAEVLLVFRVEVSAPSEWFNDETPPDSMNPDTVRAFIESTYETYKTVFGERFSEVIAGVFTDEPGIHDRHCKFTPGRGWLPWTFSFPAYFRQRRGYDILDVIPYIYYDGELSAMARHDYWRTVSEKFCESYSKQLGEWCESNGIAFTGHYLWENALGVATRVGGAVMPHYRYQQVPGIDMLCEQTDEYLTVKQCTSVANQYGRKFVLTETYGCTGWGFTFEGQKWIGDWQYVLGVNVRSQHLALYSLKGCRKRDYPPVFHYQTSWWKYNRIVEDYFARIGAVLTEGKPVRDILVLHPASTAWSMLGTTPYENKRRGLDADIPVVDRYGDEFNDLLRALLGAHYDFDLGDETIMAEEGRVQGQELFIKLAGYRTVILPPIRTMLRSTCELLTAFLDAGGRVLALTPVATMVEGRIAEEAGRLYLHPGLTVVGSTPALLTSLAELQPRAVSIRGQDGAEVPELLYLLKQTDGGHTLFMVNNDRTRSFDVCIEADAAGSVEEWDALTGTITPVPARTVDGRLFFEARFGPADSKLYVIDGQQASSLSSADPPSTEQASSSPLPEQEEVCALLGSSLRFTRTMPNVLTLDECVYRIGDGAWSDAMQVWMAQREIRASLGMRQVYYNGITQRHKWIRQEHPHNGTPVSFSFVFEVRELTPVDIHLVLESARQFRIRLNGREVRNEPQGWFVDRSFDQVLLPGVSTGFNLLELSCAYDQSMEIEDCYLIGSFAVTPDRALTQEPQLLQAGDWGQQGYLHYNGSMIYHAAYTHREAPGTRTLLRLGDYSAVTVEVRVNGRTAGHVPWKAADGVDLTACLREGDNALEIEVMGSPRNMFGPFHQAGGDTQTTSWESFRCEGDAFTPAYHTQPYGLFGQAKIVQVRNA